MVGQLAVWKIRVHGPAKFAERSGRIARVLGNSAYTEDGKELRLADRVENREAVVGGGSWALEPE